VFSGINNKIEIICPEHGSFTQEVYRHLSGQGCPKCRKNYPGVDRFIEKANIKHNNKYNYNKVQYKDSKTKVIVSCKDHGDFSITPNDHIQGVGCPKCSYKYMDRDKFIIKANKKHDNKYIYDKVNYIDYTSPVTIVCPEHGEFNMLPKNHLQGSGCKKCTSKFMDTDKFIKRANILHSNKYIYLDEYKGMDVDIKVTCLKHGEFTITPKKHLYGSGCYICENRVVDTKSFIYKAEQLHKGRYLYHKVQYKNTKTEVDIICKEHSCCFSQTPKGHLARQEGCPKCKAKKLSRDPEFYRNKPTKLYIIRIKDVYKLGVTLHTGADGISKRYSKDIRMGMEYTVIQEWDFSDGFYAGYIEDKVLSESVKYSILQERTAYIPSGGGYSEIRTTNPLDSVLHIIDTRKLNEYIIEYKIQETTHKQHKGKKC